MVDPKEFDPSWLRQKVELEPYFNRLLESYDGPRMLPFRLEIEQARNAIRQLWQAGDELWFWRYYIGEGPSGAAGLAVLRHGKVFHLWAISPCIL